MLARLTGSYINLRHLPSSLARVKATVLPDSWGTEEHILKVILDRREECADIVRLFGSCEMNTLASLAKLIIPDKTR